MPANLETGPGLYRGSGQGTNFAAPFVILAGSTVFELAAQMHQDIARRCKFTRVWGWKTFEGQRVQRDYVLQEGDVLIGEGENMV